MVTERLLGPSQTVRFFTAVRGSEVVAMPHVTATVFVVDDDISVRESLELLNLWQLVEADLSHDWSIEELASRSKVSREQLRRLCHKQMACSPMDHVMSLRMRHAQNLLRLTDEKLNVISASVGYSTAFAFSAAFKRFAGVSPSEYRNSARSRDHKTVDQ